jgi:hypothetical protein
VFVDEDRRGEDGIFVGRRPDRNEFERIRDGTWRIDLVISASFPHARLDGARLQLLDGAAAGALAEDLPLEEGDHGVVVLPGKG